MSKKRRQHKKHDLRRHLMKRSQQDFEYLLNHVAVMAKMSWMPKNYVQVPGKPELAYSLNFMCGWNEVVKKKLKIAVPGNWKNYDDLMDAFIIKVNNAEIRWFFIIEVHIQKPDGEVYVRPMELVPDVPVKIQELSEVYKASRDELMSGINANHKIVDVVWKAAKNIEGVEEKLQKFEPTIRQ